MQIVNFFDIGSLDCGEALTLFRSPLSALATAHEEARVVARRARYGPRYSYHVGQATSFYLKLSQSQRVIPALLRQGSLALNLFLIDPQLQDNKIDELRRLSRVLPNLAIYPLRAAVSDHSGLSFVKLFLTRSGSPLGSSLFATKNNVDVNKFDRVPCFRMADVIRSVEDECSVRSGAYNILRINAEGAEYAIMKAMEAAGYLNHFGLFMGAGHDLRKIDPALYAQYLHFLSAHGISFVDFKASDRKKALNAVATVERLVLQLIASPIRPV